MSFAKDQVQDAYDVVVVGSGAGGAPVALSLARHGAKVLMVDRGPRYLSKDFVHDEIRIARRNFFVPNPSTDPHVLVIGEGAPQRTHEGWISSCVGGGTVHMSGFFYRLAPVDFRLREFMGAVAGAEIANWPITYDQMAPYYDKVQAEIGVSGPADEGPFAPKRGASYPLPPVAHHPAAALIDKAAKSLGVHAFQTPRAIISAPYDGRSGCTYCKLCGSFGCEVGAKSSTLDTLIPKGEATGNLTVLADTMVMSLNQDPTQADKVQRAILRSKDGPERAVHARVFVVACSAIESARLLLLSELGNAEGQVGRHLMFSTLAKAHGAFRFADHADIAPMLRGAAPFLGRSLLDYYLPKDGGPKKAGALNFLFPSGGPIYQSETQAVRGDGVLFGKALKDALRQYWHEEKQLECEGFGEYLPTPNTRVTLDPDVKDAFGLPVARMTIDRHPHDLKVSAYLGAQAAAMLEAAGASKVWQSNIGGRTMHLPMGTLRMGKDPTTSAVDASCKVHGLRNVFVTDGSVFPSSGGVPPTWTILANSFRVGDAIIEAMQKRLF